MSATSMDTSASARAYVAWLKAQGVQHKSCAIGFFDDTGRGAVATRDIAAGEVVIEVRATCT